MQRTVHTLASDAGVGAAAVVIEPAHAPRLGALCMSTLLCFLRVQTFKRARALMRSNASLHQPWPVVCKPEYAQSIVEGR